MTPSPNTEFEINLTSSMPSHCGRLIDTVSPTWKDAVIFLFHFAVTLITITLVLQRIFHD